jgi:uncharacterized protein
VSPSAQAPATLVAYADTSALVKLFVVEEGSRETRETLSTIRVLGTGLLSRVELGAALARGVRRGLLSCEDGIKAREQLNLVWSSWVRIGIDEGLAARAEAVAWQYGLRGYDAIHLATALEWQERLRYPVMLATYDRELAAAGRQAGLDVWPGADAYI